MEGRWQEEWARACARVEERERARRRLELQRGRVDELRARVAELRGELALEERDVERLRGLSFQRLVQTLFGDRERALAEEEREAVEARMRLQDAAAELERRERKLRELAAAWEALAGAEEEREELARRREAELRAAPGPLGEELRALERREDALAAELAEVEEALGSGSDADEVLEEAVSELSSAAAWGTWDLFGGGLFVTMAKHGRVDAARRLFREAGEALWDFERELRDVARFDVPELELEPLHVGLDYLLDGLFVDLFVQGRIQRARQAAATSRDQVQAALATLQARHGALTVELEALRASKRALIERSSLDG